MFPGQSCPGLSSPWGFYYFCLGLAVICTWMTTNIAGSRFGRSLVAIRDAEVAAEAVGISKPPCWSRCSCSAARVAGIAGGLFASLQSYITPDAFTFDLSVLFFIAILIGGRGSILGPLLGTIILTALPEFAAPLVAWSTFLYAVLLLVIVLAVPGGIADMLDFKNRRPLEQHREIRPRPELLAQRARPEAQPGLLTLEGPVAELRRRARDRRRGSRDPHGRSARTDRPQRQRQDHDAERDLRLLCAAGRASASGRQDPPVRARRTRAPACASRAPFRPHVWWATLRSWKTS